MSLMKTTTLCLWALLFSGNALMAASPLPLIVDPVVVETPPGATVTAAYMSIVNNGTEDIVISGAYSTTIRKVEIHESRIENDVAKMVHQESLTVKAGETVVLEHGKLHLMLMALDKPLKSGETVDIILSTSAGDLLIDVPVARLGENAHSTMTHEQHGNTMQDKASEGESMHSHGEADESSSKSKSEQHDAHTHTGETKNVN